MFLLNSEHKMLSTAKIKKIGLLLLIVIVFDFVFFAAPLITAAANSAASLSEQEKEELSIANSTPALIGGENSEPLNPLPKGEDLRIKWTKKVYLTAYNSEVAQCDDTPCITANGFNVCEHGIEDTIAANFLKFGTKVRIPDLFGDRIFIVRDRMNKRYTERVDVWMKSKPNAIDFGVRYAEIQVLE